MKYDFFQIRKQNYLSNHRQIPNFYSESSFPPFPILIYQRSYYFFFFFNVDPYPSFMVFKI